ncbi:hypothetical protein RHGRI_017936 [Rhododendron griersonianum]|uniref:non-specific serine/threonine protein kinase n=1 Tax=Rhododendron griersonianum TaxID=479676 RepID=A0AAV6JZM8_9ERIC|nr:hypothetical protein RHGRI_017936 [Rhododendron griersonianum]
MLGFRLLGLLLLAISVFPPAESQCSKGCDLALGSYYVWQGSNLTFIAEVTNEAVVDIQDQNQMSNPDSVLADTRINVPFSCDCLDAGFLGHVFEYAVRSGDTYSTIAGTYYANLTTAGFLEGSNSYPAINIPDNGVVNVTVNCSCGNAAVSKEYGLFVTYPLREGDTLESVAAEANLTADANLTANLLQRYNPGVDFSAGSGLVYIPGKDKNGKYPPLESSTGLSVGVIAGIAVAGVAGALLLGFSVYIGLYRKKKVQDQVLLSATPEDQSFDTATPGGASSGLAGITVDKSVEFSHEELAKATNDFNIANKIGQGGFGAVYYAELRGEKAAIKKMDMQASREFLAELKVLTRVHHLNLVRLIGYCVEGSLFLVYEYIENGNLSEHLRGSGNEPLPWSTRVQIALDSARGLEYIHEHTVPVYIHRDIKSANILIDKNFHGKVADFGLAKLTEVGVSLPTRLVGTFGYMPPEYAQYGDVSPKVDVFAFGVVLYELISAKEAIVKASDLADSKGLVALFDEVLSQQDPRENLSRLVDPRLGDNYPLDSLRKVAQLARACTQENPQLRPSMRSVVVALMTLSSTTEDWDVASFYENQDLVNLMSGRVWFFIFSGFSLGDLLRARRVKEQATNVLFNKISLLLQKEENNLRTEALPRLQEVEEILGYTFKNSDLLEEAFTHASYQEKCLSYERLEYVGDSVLNILITKEQYFLYPNFPPGALSSLRSANVDTEKLARVAVKNKLHKYLRLRQPVLRKQIGDFVAALPKYPLHSNGLIDAPKVLADVVESTIGAIFIDSNSSLETTWEVAKGLLQPIITPEVLQTHPVRKLYETCQKHGLKLQLVDLWLKEGAYEVIVDKNLKGRGKCRAKKEVALNRAANNAYIKVVTKLGLKQ